MAASNKPHPLHAAVAALLPHLPGAEVQTKFGNLSLSIGGKVFAFTRPDGLVLKLPRERIAQLMATRDAEFLVMGKRTMKEWVLLRYSAAHSYGQELPLLQEAMAFVVQTSAT